MEKVVEKNMGGGRMNHRSGGENLAFGLADGRQLSFIHISSG